MLVLQNQDTLQVHKLVAANGTDGGDSQNHVALAAVSQQHM